MYINREPLGRGNLHFGKKKKRFHPILVTLYILFLVAALLVFWQRDRVQAQVLVAIGPTVTPTISPDWLVAEADTAYAEGDNVQAIDLYQQAMQISGPDYLMYTQISLIQTLEGRYEEAVASADQAIALAPDEPDGHAARARALNWSGDYDQATISALQAIDQDAAFALAHAVLAETYADLGRLRQAREEAELAIQLDPFNADTRRAYGYVLEYYGDYTGAAQQYEQALRLEPNRLDLWYGLARNLRGAGQTELAVNTFLQWAIRDPYNPLPFTEIGKTYFEIRDDGAAQEYLEQAIDLVCTDCPRTDYDVIEARLERGEAAISADAVPSIEEMYTPAWRRLGMVFFTRRNYESSLEIFEELIAYGETHQTDIPLEAYYVTASAYFYLDQCNIAIPRTIYALDLYEDGLLDDPDALRNILSIFVLCRDYAVTPYEWAEAGFENGFPVGYEEPCVVLTRTGSGGTSASCETDTESSGE